MNCTLSQVYSESGIF
uniref:Uncharacterized protein n=1 Tax=Anguilla anguilla TaxID=7936 RepID=A0A0E9Q1N3_ANGAN